MQVTAPDERLWQARRDNERKSSMRLYVEIVAIIMGLLGAYVVLLPLTV